MTSLPGRAARTIGLSGAEKRVAESALGRQHPLARALSIRQTVVRQLLVTVVALVVATGAVLAHLDGAWVFLGASALVCAALTLALAATRHVVRIRTYDLIADGQGSALLPVVARARRRLASPKERERLARSLERLLRDARRWDELLPNFRPLPGVECLRMTAPEVETVATLLRREHVPTRGVALTARFLESGSGSPLYSGNVELLREELDCIRRALEDESVTAADAWATRAAA